MSSRAQQRRPDHGPASQGVVRNFMNFTGLSDALAAFRQRLRKIRETHREVSCTLGWRISAEDLALIISQRALDLRFRKKPKKEEGPSNTQLLLIIVSILVIAIVGMLTLVKEDMLYTSPGGRPEKVH